MPHKVLPPESIYEFIPKEEVKIVKPLRYISKFREQVKLETELAKASMKTMGPAKVEMPSPQKHLLKHSREAGLPPKKPFSYGQYRPKAPVPYRSDCPPLPEHVKKDFVKNNVITNITSVPSKPQPACVDTKHGDTYTLKNSGLIPQYIKKRNFGQVPQYLQRRQAEMKRAQEEHDNYIKECMKKGAMKQLTEEERKDIIQGLKTNWNELHHQYQGLSVITDTVRKKYRKESLEQSMKKLEMDIKLMERYKLICIANN